MPGLGTRGGPSPRNVVAPILDDLGPVPGRSHPPIRLNDLALRAHEQGYPPQPLRRRRIRPSRIAHSNAPRVAWGRLHRYSTRLHVAHIGCELGAIPAPCLDDLQFDRDVLARPPLARRSTLSLVLSLRRVCFPTR